jgi:AbrB family looped-hinge helix DNA binding protein
MIRARVTSKGQVTVPVTIRRMLNLQPGDDLIFNLDINGGITIRGLGRKQLTELYGSLSSNRPYPGKMEVREEVADKLAIQTLNKGKE